MSANGIGGSRSREDRGRGSAGKVSLRGGNTYGKSKKKSRAGAGLKKRFLGTGKMIEPEKVNLLAQKHQELEHVIDRHDTLVCSYPSSFLFCHTELRALLTCFEM